MLRRLQGRQIVGIYPLLADEPCWRKPAAATRPGQVTAVGAGSSRRCVAALPDPREVGQVGVLVLVEEHVRRLRIAVLGRPRRGEEVLEAGKIELGGLDPQNVASRAGGDPGVSGSLRSPHTYS
jgi:hypothetical protein